MAEKHEDHASKASEQAMHENDAHLPTGKSHDAVPGDNTAHAHSHAAHLGEAHEKTKAEGNQPGGSKVGELREPPQEVGRVGKDNRRQ